MFLLFFFFKQKTAYDMRIIDWISDVCSSDLAAPRGAWHGAHRIHAGSFHVASQTPSCDSMRLRYIAENDTQGAMIKFSAGSPPLVMGRRRRTISRRGVRHLWASIFGCGSQAAARGLAQGDRKSVV